MLTAGVWLRSHQKTLKMCANTAQILAWWYHLSPIWVHIWCILGNFWSIFNCNRCYQSELLRISHFLPNLCSFCMVHLEKDKWIQIIKTMTKYTKNATEIYFHTWNLENFECVQDISLWSRLWWTPFYCIFKELSIDTKYVALWCVGRWLPKPNLLNISADWGLGGHFDLN